MRDFGRDVFGDQRVLEEPAQRVDPAQEEEAIGIGLGVGDELLDATSAQTDRYCEPLIGEADVPRSGARETEKIAGPRVGIVFGGVRVHVLDTRDEQRAAGRTERVVATVPSGRHALGDREGEAIGHPQEAPQIGGRTYPLEIGVNRATTKNLDVIALERTAELRVERALRPVGEGRDRGVFAEPEVAGIVAHVDAVETEADERPKTHLGEGDRDRVAPFESLQDTEVLEIVAHLVIENEGVREIAELSSEGELDRLPAEIAMAILERSAKALAGRKSGAKIEVLRDALLHLDHHDLALGGDLRIGQEIDTLEKVPKVAMRSSLLRTSLAR